MIIGKTFTFEASHYLPGHEKCGKMHGHTYKVTVEVIGFIGPNGMVMDLHELGKKVKSVIEKYDHTTLNHFFEIPSCENIAEGIFEELRPQMPLYSVQVQEGEGGYARCER